MSAVRSFRLPDLGEGLADAEIVAWRVAAGDAVALNQILAEVETEKAVVELPSPFAGTVVELLAEPGETVAVGAPIVTIETVAQVGDDPASERTGDPSAWTRAHARRLRAGRGCSEPSASSPDSRPRAGERHDDRPWRPARSGRDDPRGRRDHGPAPGRRPSGTTSRRAPVRFMARQVGVDLAEVPGHGPGGIITATTSRRTSEAGPGQHRPPRPWRTARRRSPPAQPETCRPPARASQSVASRSGWPRP